MFDVGFSELVIIALVALLVLGPERLPAAARTVGALLRRARSGWDNVRAEVEREVRADELKRELDDGVQQVQQLASQSQQRMTSEAKRIAAAADPRPDATGNPARDHDEPT